MNAEASQHSSHYSPQKYFKNALQLFEAVQIPIALQSLDAAIFFSNNSPFYIHQKVRILYKLGALDSCHQFIMSQLEYLYKHGSFYILCRTIDFLQLIKHYSTGQLQTILHQHHIPYCLANHYKEWLTTAQRPFASLAQTAFRKDNYERCISYCQLFLKNHAPIPSILYIMAYSYHMTYDFEQATHVYDAYLRLVPTNIDARLAIIFISMESKQYEQGISSLKELLSQDPHNKTYLSYLGECYYQANKPLEALQTFETIVKHHPDDLQNLFNLFHSYTFLNKNWRAKHTMKEIQKRLKYQKYC